MLSKVNLILISSKSLGQSTQSVLTGMWTSHTSLWQIKTSGFILANGKVDIDKKMEVCVEHSFPLAKVSLKLQYSFFLVFMVWWCTGKIE